MTPDPVCLAECQIGRRNACELSGLGGMGHDLIRLTNITLTLNAKEFGEVKTEGLFDDPFSWSLIRNDHHRFTIHHTTTFAGLAGCWKSCKADNDMSAVDTLGLTLMISRKVAT